MTAALLALMLAVPVQERDADATRKCADAARTSLVGLEIRLKKKSKIEKLELQFEALDPEQEQLFRLSEEETPFETWGVVVDEAGTVLMPDLGVKPREIESIRAFPAEGEPYALELKAVGRSYDFAVLQPRETRTGTPPEFAAFEKFPLASFYYTAFLERLDGQWHVNVSGYIVTNTPLADRKDWLLLDRVRRGSLLFDAAGRCVGIPFDEFLWVTEDGRDGFIGSNVVKDERVSFDDLDEAARRIQKSIAGSARKLVARLRVNPGEEYYDPEEQSDRLTLFGLPLDEKGTLLLTQVPATPAVKRIEELVCFEGGRPVPAAFVGAFKKFEAGVVRVEGASTKPIHRDDLTALRPGELFYTIALEERFGRVFATVKPNRVFRSERGHGDAWHPRPRRIIKKGALLVDADGRVFGFWTADRKDEDPEDATSEQERMRYWRYERMGYGGDGPLHRAFLLGGLKDVLAAPADHFDPKVMPMSKREEKAVVWLGVEYQEVGKALAERLGVADRELTNDGRRGLLVTDVYPDSPAARAGLKADDILLSVAPDGGSSIDLTLERNRWEGYGFGMNNAPWRAQLNYLNQLLTGIGEGKKARIDVLRGIEKSTIELTLERSPATYDTAESHKDEDLGLTVRDLTYEVRYFHRVSAEDAGAVVAKIESGSRAEVAKLQQLSVVLRVDGRPVAGAAAFREAMERKRASGEKSVTLTVLNLGQTRLVDLELAK